jgi:hypothetical protein
MHKDYQHYQEKECTELHYNYVQSGMESNGDRIDLYPDGWTTAKVGEKGVVLILEHETRGEGDRWFFDIVREDNTVERVFNPHRAFYKLPS